MKTIDHDPNKKKEREPFILRWLWPIAFMMMAFPWGYYLFTGSLDWDSLSLGLATGFLVVCFAWAKEKDSPPNSK